MRTVRILPGVVEGKGKAIAYGRVINDDVMPNMCVLSPDSSLLPTWLKAWCRRPRDTHRDAFTYLQELHEHRLSEQLRCVNWEWEVVQRHLVSLGVRCFIERDELVERRVRICSRERSTRGRNEFAVFGGRQSCYAYTIGIEPLQY